MADVIRIIADEFKLKGPQVEGLVALLKEECSVPFIAQYRKERTGGLTDSKIRAIRDRWRQLEEMEQRRALAVKAIVTGGKMTPEFQAKLETTTSRAELEDLYMPYRSRRRVRSSAARQKGLEGLAELIWKQLTPEQASAAIKTADAAKPETKETAPAAAPQADAATPVPAQAQAGEPATAADATTPAAAVQDVQTAEPKEAAPATAAQTPAAETKPQGPAKAEDLVKPYINPEKGVKDMADALAGARDIVAERIAEDAACRKIARDLLHSEGKFTVKAREGVDLTKGKYAAFAQVSEPIGKVSSHRLLLALRGASEKQLTVTLEAPREKIVAALKALILTNPGALLSPELALGIEEAYDRLLAPALDNETRQEMKRTADLEMIAVCCKTLRAILLQPPLGRKPVMGIEAAPGVGLKIAVLDGSGKVLTSAIANASKGEEERKVAAELLAKYIKEHGTKAVAIADGPGSRETDLLVREVLKGDDFKEVFAVIVHRHGAPLPTRESTDVEPAIRGAAAAGRYLQDPLAELAKLDLTHISVGQHQHDVDQGLLRQTLAEVVESCIAEIGVDVNTANAAVLGHVPGIGPKLVEALVATRDTKNGFKSREDLRDIPGGEPKTFEQCAGFLRVSGSANALDTTPIHPESYAAVEAMAASVNASAKDLLDNAELIGKLDLAKFKTEQCGDWTLQDIVAALKTPGRDVRGEFVKPEFNSDVREVADLKEGMLLNGVVTNLTAFGAFVDVGVHQDGLVHISAITRKFIRDASEVLTVGQRVKVKVLSADLERKRISLSMKELEPTPPPRPASRPAAQDGQRPASRPAGERPARPPRPPRPPSAAAAPAATAAPAAAAAAAAAPAAAPAAAAAGSVGPGAPRRFGDKREGKERSGGAGRPGGPGRGGERRGPPAKPVEPGKPDYSKFFVRGKRKEREKTKGPREQEGASRDEVRQIMRSQEGGGTTLGDLLRKAGVEPGEEKK